MLTTRRTATSLQQLEGTQDWAGLTELIFSPQFSAGDLSDRRFGHRQPAGLCGNICRNCPHLCRLHHRPDQARQGAVGGAGQEGDRNHARAGAGV